MPFLDDLLVSGASRNEQNVERKVFTHKAQTSRKATIPANLCLFLRWVEFSGVGEDFDEAAGKASELAA
jgi:hypothetical protein